MYNKFKICTIDRLLLPEYKIDEKDFLIYQNRFPFSECGVNIELLNEGDVKRYMRDWYKWTQEEFLLVFNQRCWIEPDQGWAIVSPCWLMYYSLGISRTWFLPRPSLLRFLQKKNVLNLKAAISLRDSGEENYFHFYNDVLAKLFFLHDKNIDIENVPIIISQKLWETQYFQYFRQNNSWLLKLNWVPQALDQYIQCDSVIFCKPITHQPEIWRKIKLSLTAIPAPIVGRKVFLTRAKSRLRFIENNQEIEDVCIRYGLEVIDADCLSFEEQVRLFSHATFVAGIHGAGLTNMIFSLANCKVFEIFPPADQGYLPYHYFLLATINGFQYKGMIGNSGKRMFSGGFYVNPIQFENELSDFL